MTADPLDPHSRVAGERARLELIRKKAEQRKVAGAKPETGASLESARLEAARAHAARSPVDRPPAYVRRSLSETPGGRPRAEEGQ